MDFLVIYTQKRIRDVEYVCACMHIIHCRIFFNYTQNSNCDVESSAHLRIYSRGLNVKHFYNGFVKYKKNW